MIVTKMLRPGVSYGSRAAFPDWPTAQTRFSFGVDSYDANRNHLADERLDRASWGHDPYDTAKWGTAADEQAEVDRAAYLADALAQTKKATEKAAARARIDALVAPAYGFDAGLTATDWHALAAGTAAHEASPNAGYGSPGIEYTAEQDPARVRLEAAAARLKATEDHVEQLEREPMRVYESSIEQLVSVLMGDRATGVHGLRLDRDQVTELHEALGSWLATKWINR